MPKSKAQQLRPFYRVGELARLSGISPKRLRRMLRASGIVFRKAGRRRLIYLSDIRVRMPALWASLEMHLRFAMLAEALEGHRALSADVGENL
jgi:hypothetical protein